MAYRLKDRNKQVPGGLKFHIAETKFSPFPFSSFKTIVDAVIQHRRVNPFLTKKHGWSLDWDTVAWEVDRYNAAICAAHGWGDYIIEDAKTVAAPKATARPQPSRSVKNAAVAVEIISDMFGPEGPIRDSELATRRAAVCVVCPKHEKGDWTRFFTIPAQFAIRKVLGLVKDLNLSTKYDEQLMVCGACQCPMKGKVWARVEHILAHIQPEAKAQLDVNCWILGEEKKSNA